VNRGKRDVLHCFDLIFDLICSFRFYIVYIVKFVISSCDVSDVECIRSFDHSYETVLFSHPMPINVMESAVI
jgi:hypothetical protein